MLSAILMIYAVLSYAIWLAVEIYTAPVVCVMHERVLDAFNAGENVFVPGLNKIISNEDYDVIVCYFKEDSDEYVVYIKSKFNL